jgi:phospholipid transport system substrate-binding protein
LGAPEERKGEAVTGGLKRGSFSMTSRRAFLGLAAALAAGIGIAPGAQAAASKEAETFISGRANEALKSLSDKLPESEIETRFRALLDQNFDMPRISRFVLGRYWNGATDPEKQDFQRLFEAYVVRAYSIRFSEYSGQAVKVTGSRSESADNTVVASQIVQPDGAPPVRLDWIVRKDGDGFRIADVSVEGVSMVLTQKQEFAAVIERSGGGVTALNKAIQDKISSTKTAQQ